MVHGVMEADAQRRAFRVEKPRASGDARRESTPTARLLEQGWDKRPSHAKEERGDNGRPLADKYIFDGGANDRAQTGADHPLRSEPLLFAAFASNRTSHLRFSLRLF
jgi:hypothetical protein